MISLTITGVTSGLGDTTVVQLAKENAILSLVDINKEGLEEIKKRL